MENDKEIEMLIENITLNVFNTGTKQTNFKIIKALPTNVDYIMKETGLTKVPVNKHLNDLEKFGLLTREKGTGNVYPTELTSLFKMLIEEVEKHVSINVSKMLPKMIN
ncbi:MAG: winged helix-turn-helix transcriptional regulator [Methanosarcinaceae archaeon]|nr:winged helix-turn-helix transcriptional regulator [Methanosarcinaceae archaeon]